MQYDFSRGLGWRIPFSIVFSIGWLVFVIIWLAFYAGMYSGYQNFGMILGSILFVFLVVGGVWAWWGFRMIPEEGWEMMRIAGFKWRIFISIILPFFGMFFLVIWFFVFAESFNVYQNIAVFIILWLIIGGLLGVLWAQYGMRHKKDFESMEDIGEEIDRHFRDKENK